MEKTKSPKKKTKTTIVTKEQRYLKCDLSDEELLTKGTDLANKLDRITALEDTKKAHAAQLKAQIEELTAQVKVLHGAVRNKWEFRNVDCKHELIHKTAKVKVTRIDTGAVIVDRKMTTAE